MPAPEGFDVVKKETTARGGKGQTQNHTGGSSSGTNTSERSTTETRNQATDVETSRELPSEKLSITVADPTTRTQTQTVPANTVTSTTTRAPSTVTKTEKGHAVVHVKMRIQILTVQPGPDEPVSGLSC